MRTRAALVAILGSVAAHAAPAAADAPPSGMIGPVVGVRSGIGAVGPEFNVGGLWGIEAGWQPIAATRRIGYAIRWRTLFSGYWSGDNSNIADELRVVEMDLGFYGRFAPAAGKPRYIDLGAGWSLLRSNVPLAPDARRSYQGPYIGFGLEQLVSASASVSIELRVGELTGPDTVSALLGVRFGV